MGVLAKIAGGIPGLEGVEHWWGRLREAGIAMEIL
jgi:hypothetical protein